MPDTETTPAYNAAKAGLHGLVAALASELEGRGIYRGLHGCVLCVDEEPDLFCFFEKETKERAAKG